MALDVELLKYDSLYFNYASRRRRPETNVTNDIFLVDISLVEMLEVLANEA